MQVEELQALLKEYSLHADLGTVVIVIPAVIGASPAPFGLGAGSAGLVPFRQRTAEDLKAVLPDISELFF